ncbi:MAG: histone deacetylase [Acidobacteria bacterium]|nr:histone deacetylase [Acidobacteriota bacterium]
MIPKPQPHSYHENPRITHATIGSPMPPLKLIYTDQYDLNLGQHIFPAVKYKLVRQALLEKKIASEADFLEPEAVQDRDVLLVHSAAYVRKLKTGTLSELEIARMEIPYSPEMIRAVWLCAGGSTLTGRRAIADGIAVNLAGGFHHAFPAHGEGFCAIHDVGIAIRKLQAAGAIGKAMTVDLDVHHGNGTAAIFARDESVYTFSMHQENNYPFEKPPGNLDVPLQDGCGDEEYLRLLRQNLQRALSEFQPDLIFYLAGADPYCEDQLGGLSLTLAGLRERDRMVFQMARMKGVPVAVTLAGGYAARVDDTVAIHVGTVQAGREALAGETKGRSLRNER